MAGKDSDDREDWIDRASQRLLVPIKIAIQERGGGHGVQAELAREIGIEQSLFSKWVRGARKRVDIKTIETVSEFFEIDPGYIFDPHVDDDWKKYADARLEPALKTQSEMDVVLDDMNATPEERESLRAHVAKYRHHRVTATLIQFFLHGLRHRPKR